MVEVEATGSAARAIWSSVDEPAFVRHHSLAGLSSVVSVTAHGSPANTPARDRRPTGASPARSL